MKNNHQQHGEYHQPVLAKEVLHLLQPQPGQSYLDLTAGYGGHAALVLEATGSPERAVLVDRDQMAIDVLRQKFGQAQIVQSDYLAACQQLAEAGEHFDMILADLGVSSVHLDIAERGFSFNQAGPLDMRMDQNQELSAKALVNEAVEQELAKIIKEYGEEPKAKAIARRIVQNRPVNDTKTLAELISQAYGPWVRTARTHPATRTFQALRMAVNDELTQLTMALPLMSQLLAPGGRLAIISFHSLEDRIVKDFFRQNAGERYDASLRLLTKKPLTAGSYETSLNPRARSAKLRAVAKIKNQ